MGNIAFDEWKVDMTAEEIAVPILSDSDIVSARQKARELAKNHGFSSSELAVIAAAISELARNIVSYALTGIIRFKMIDDNGKKGIEIVAEDNGPGIKDIQLAMQDGYSTSNSLGLGLPGVRRLMDSFTIKSELGQGTHITVKKWVTL